MIPEILVVVMNNVLHCSDEYPTFVFFYILLFTIILLFLLVLFERMLIFTS